MKNVTPYLLFVVSLTLLAPSCKKQPADQLSLLPPATQTGANTFGCLVNGVAFVPKVSFLLPKPVFQCQYGFSAQGYVFYIGASINGDNGATSNVLMRTDSLKISEGETLPLTKYATPGMSWGAYNLNLTPYQTNATVTGALTITHLDTIKQIVSATFYYNAVSTGGDMVKITNGRFDVHYML